MIILLSKFKFMFLFLNAKSAKFFYIVLHIFRSQKRKCSSHDILTIKIFDFFNLCVLNILKVF
ncbi:hypothetical protein RM51_04890 [Chryseobacterium taiwanense]|uniref:Uncharacterized protein n=1 Tax=Chryseobacterium taiwanense TaxID=363331 RepID=A0A0B4DBH6_9FLAO|nr:hypothetical protein RM51_04890 [Chryseobacterium taiwanense]